MTIKIGADPELFLKYKGKDFISAEDHRGPIIPGTKQHPYEVKGGAIQVDGVAAEFNVNPSKDFKEFYKNTKSVLQDLQKRIKSFDKNLSLAPVPTARFKKRYFNNLPEHVKVLGCDPDFDAYKDGAANPRPQTDKPIRTGSGHFHIGWYSSGNYVDPHYQGHIMDCCLVAKQLDKYLLEAAKDWDTDRTRQQLYGQPGTFRPKPYGMEYRAPSNAWLKDYNSVRNAFFITLGVVRGMDEAKLNLNDNKMGYGETHAEKVISKLIQFIPEVYE